MADEPRLDGREAMASLQVTIESTGVAIRELTRALARLEEGDPHVPQIVAQLKEQNRQQREAWEALKPLIRARIGYLRALTERVGG